MPAKAPRSYCYIYTKVLFPQTTCDEKHKKLFPKIRLYLKHLHNVPSRSMGKRGAEKSRTPYKSNREPFPSSPVLPRGMFSWHIAHLRSGLHLLRLPGMPQRSILWNRDGEGTSPPQTSAPINVRRLLLEKKGRNKITCLCLHPRQRTYVAFDLLTARVTVVAQWQSCDPQWDSDFKSLQVRQWVCVTAEQYWGFLPYSVPTASNIVCLLPHTCPRTKLSFPALLSHWSLQETFVSWRVVLSSFPNGIF